MFIGICSRSQVSVYRTIGPLFFLNLTLGGSNVYTIRYIFSSIFKAKKISVYCMGNTFSEWYATYKHTERHMRQRRLKFSYFHVPLTPSVYITGSLFSRCMNLVGFTAHPYQHYPELPLPPLEERDGVLNKKAIFPYKVGA